MKQIFLNSKERIMRWILCAAAVLWANVASAGIIYLDANFSFAPASSSIAPARAFHVLPNDDVLFVERGDTNLWRVPSGGVNAIEGTHADKLRSITGVGSSVYLGTINSDFTPADIVTWNGSTFNALATMPNLGNAYATVNSLAVNSDESRIAAMVNGRLLLFDGGGSLLWDVPTPESGTYRNVAFDSSDNLIYVGALGGVYDINLSDGSAAAQVNSIPVGYEETANGIVWSQVVDDSGFIFANTIQDGTNESTLGRFNPANGDWDIIARWSEQFGGNLFRDLGFSSNGLLVTNLGAVEADTVMFDGLTINGLSFASLSASSTAGLDLIQGDFLGAFAGFSGSGFNLIPEPVCWPVLLLGFLFTRKKRAVRFSPLQYST